MTCRTCKWLEVTPNKAGKIVVRAANMYPCRVPIPALPEMPACLPVSFILGDLYGGAIKWPPKKQYMAPDDGDGCTFHEPRTKP